MENMYSLDPATTSTGFHHQGPQLVLEKLLHGQFETTEADNIHETHTITMDHHHHQQMSDVIKAQIASHPLYPDLVSAYIQCRQVGAPPEMALLLEEIGRDQSNCGGGLCSSSHEIGTDPELDEFMESYCKVFLRYKEELSKPFDEATTFLNNIEIQLSNLLLSKGTSSTPTNTATTSGTGSGSYHSPDGAAGSSEEELSYGEAEASESHESSAPRAADQELKEMLMRKYSGYLSSLRKEFLKKRKKGKLPKDARTTLMDWWNTHCRWPYPTEEEKMKLADVTGLDQKQINNWFINQRKRHWKPSEDMSFALREGVGGGGAPVYFDSSGKGPADVNDLR
ncbi:hypothetical protein MKX01_025305 [Papaver californicum]|nr:hypothetical protein MKX01_025305 [Papaver californicum]